MRVRPWMVAVAAPILCYVLLDAAARAALSREGWFDSWQGSTRGDTELGYRLRANLFNHLEGAVVYTNADGFRAVEAGGHFASKASDELLIVALGASNTFGAGVAYEDAYPALLERNLERRLAAPVRVLNMGGLGYSLLQSFAIAKKWAHLQPDLLVLAVNGFNDRAFVGRADSEQAFAHDARSRPYEFGDFISYPMLYWHRMDLLQGVRQAPAPTFSQWPPVPRVPRPLFASVLREFIEFTRSHGTTLVLLTAAEQTDSEWSETGLKLLRERRMNEALAAFLEAQKVDGLLFLPAYYAHHCALSLGLAADARAIRSRYESSYATMTDPYQHNLSHFAMEYLPTVTALADSFDLSLVDVRQQFRTHDVQFVKGHYDETGHELVAEELARQIAVMVQPHLGL